MELRSDGWSDSARAGLEKLIRAGSGKGLPVVFDFDNTIVCGDMGEATLAVLAREGVVRKDGIPGALAPPFISGEGRRISLAECADITVYYEELLGATRHQGNDTAPLSNGYVWAVEIMQGLRVSDVVHATDRAYALGEPLREKMIEVTPGKSAYPAPFFYPQMVELIAVLLRGRYDVWIVSASNAWTIRRIALSRLNSELRKHGIGEGIRPERVVGVSTLLSGRDGRLYKDPLLVRNDPRYAGMDDEALSGLTLTARLNLPAPVYSGKVANILDLVPGRPYLAAGDSPGDLPMLAFSENRLWIARLEKTGYQGECAALAGRVKEGAWLVQPVLTKKTPGFVEDVKKTWPPGHGEVPGPVAASVKALEEMM